MAHRKIRSSRRPHYFTGELLKEDDFRSEQAYHIEMRRRLTSVLHEWGIAGGLLVTREGDRKVSVSPGLAIDALGREIVLHATEVVEVSEYGPNAVVYLTLSYDEGFEAHDRYPSGNEEHFVSTTEYAVFGHHTGAPPKSEHHPVVLAAVHLDSKGIIKTVDLSVRKDASARLAPGAVRTEALADASVTERKLDAALCALLESRVHGWVRLPFKPSEFIEPGKLSEGRFTIGATETFCDGRGAKGTLGIPVPAGATRIKHFRVAGKKCDGSISLELFRCGWDAQKQEHERMSLLRTTVTGTPFNKTFPVGHDLHVEDHTLALYLAASAETFISLVAAEFEWGLLKEAGG
jgi:hypothetical protein